MTKLPLPLGNHNRFLRKLVCKSSLALLFFLTISISLYAQQVTISGIILDERTKAPVLGANIRIKGASGGSSTDPNGNFSVKVKSLPATLFITSVDYKNQELEVYEAVPTTIYLTEDINRLNSIVVVGYGTQKRSELMGSIASLAAKDFNQSPLTSFDKALQQIPGIQVTQAGGQPGASASIRIRGTNSITGGNEPLYVIDGFPVYNDNSNANAGVLSGGSVNALASINPADIESIDVLKDASATAIYGSRGANGVVIITTKKGKNGAKSVTYDGYYGFQKISRYIPLLNAQEWASLKNDALANSSKSALFTDDEIAALGEGTDWQKAAYRTAPVQSHQLSVSKGDDKTKYNISASYFNQDGILYGSNFERFSLKASLESQVDKQLKVGLNVNGSASYADITPSSVVTALLYMPPTVDIYQEDGSYTFQSPYESSIANPIATIHQEINESQIYRTLGSIFGEYKILEGLKAKISLGADLLSNKQNQYIPSTLYEGSTSGGIAAVGTKFSTTWLNENTLTYEKNIHDEHTYNFLVGFTQQAFSQEGLTAGNSGFITDLTTYNSLSSGTSVSTPTSTSTAWALQSWLARANYSYLQKYFFTASIRADGSSRFGTDHKWGYFPSGAISWQVNKEEFFKPLRAISNLKIRTSAGATGNQEIGQYLSLPVLSTYQYTTGSGSAYLTGYAASQIANPDLSWETTYQYDGGFDLGLLDNRINLTVDFYYKKTTNLLLSVSLPYTSGYTSATQNDGSIENKGLEISLNTDNLRGPLKWNSNVGFSINRNKVLSLGNGADYLTFTSGGITTPAIVQVGQPLGSFYGFRALGIFDSNEEATNSPQYGTQVAGDIQYADLSDDGSVTQALDREIIGSAEPLFTYSFNNNFSFKGFDLSFAFQGSYGNEIYSSLRQNLELTTGYQNGLKGLTDRWTSTNTDGTYQRANENVAVYPNSSRFVEDGSYLRLKTITLGYNLPKKLISTLKISNIKIYGTANNLYTWTNYTGYDPEVNSYEQSATHQGIDYGAYPNAKSFIAGVNLTF
jgi:TonB-dependent starch-binding outer membrane protein SusC